MTFLIYSYNIIILCQVQSQLCIKSDFSRNGVCNRIDLLLASPEKMADIHEDIL